MEKDGEVGSGVDRFREVARVSGLISAARVDPWIQKLWIATGDIVLLRELLEWEVQDRPEIRRVLERVLEEEGKLVSASEIITFSSKD